MQANKPMNHSKDKSTTRNGSTLIYLFTRQNVKDSKEDKMLHARRDSKEGQEYQRIGRYVW